MKTSTFAKATTLGRLSGSDMMRVSRTLFPGSNLLAKAFNSTRLTESVCS